MTRSKLKYASFRVGPDRRQVKVGTPDDRTATCPAGTEIPPFGTQDPVKVDDLLRF